MYFPRTNVRTAPVAIMISVAGDRITPSTSGTSYCAITAASASIQTQFVCNYEKSYSE
jgi:NifU-like protein involved in Fe-S cluster formation